MFLNRSYLLKILKKGLNHREHRAHRGRDDKNFPLPSVISVPSVVKYFFFMLLLAGCSGLEHSEYEKTRRLNATGEFIYRKHDEVLYPIETPTHQVREKYPWEEAYIGGLSKISKEFFRCRGSSLNLSRIDENDPEGKTLIFDCGGPEKHSLPVRNNKEFIYSILIDLLNFIQTKTGKKAVITCGYRCPAHNLYADNSTFNQSSKHMIGAEVDFYVQGMEQSPEEIIKLVIQFYKESPVYKGQKEFEEFQRYDGTDTNVSTRPWYNKEILIKLYKKNEGRDFDNRHPYPYLCLQVRHDKELNEKVTYSWPKSFNGYRRY